MSVTLNEPALKVLLENPVGPVGRDIQRRAEAMLHAYRERIQDITEGSISFPVTQDVEKVTREDGAVEIGIFDNGSVARYLAEKMPREPEKILPQLDIAFRS